MSPDPQQLLHPWPVSHAGRDHLAELGVDIANPAIIQPSTNKEAERILPRRSSRGSASVPATSVAGLAAGCKPFSSNAALHPFEMMAHTSGFIEPIAPAVWHIDHGVLWLAGGQLLLAVLLIFIWKDLRAMCQTKTRPVEQTQLTFKPLLLAPPVPAAQPYDRPLLIGGASRTGLVREENQDAFEIRKIVADEGLIVVCDGVGGHPGGRAAAEFASVWLADRLADDLELGVRPSRAIERALQEAPGGMEEAGITGLTTALVTYAVGDELIYGAIGDGRIVLIHEDGVAHDLLAPHHNPDSPSNVITAWLAAGSTFEPRLGSARFRPGSILLVMSDGAGDILPDEQVAKSRRGLRREMLRTGANNVAEALLLQLETARDPETSAYLHSDNMTLALATHALPEED